MPSLSIGSSTIIALIAFGASLAFLYSLASFIRNETHIHDLKLRVTQLRRSHFSQLTQDDGEPIEVDEAPIEVDEAPSESASPASAPPPAQKKAA